MNNYQFFNDNQPKELNKYYTNYLCIMHRKNTTISAINNTNNI